MPLGYGKKNSSAFIIYGCGGHHLGLVTRTISYEIWVQLTKWFQRYLKVLTDNRMDNRLIVIDRKHFIKYWPVWFEHCGYMWHICLQNASQSHVIRLIGWFNIVYQVRHHVSLKRFLWKCHAENVFKNVLVHTIWSVYGWIP